MSYAVQADMISAFGEAEMIRVTDRANLGVLDATVLQQALDDATAEADSYIPIAPTTPNRALVRHTAAIARFLLHKDAASNEIRERYTDAIAWLKLASLGRVTYGTLPAVPAGSATQGIPQSQSLTLSHEQYEVPRTGGFVW